MNLAHESDRLRCSIFSYFIFQIILCVSSLLSLSLSLSLCATSSPTQLYFSQLSLNSSSHREHRWQQRDTPTCHKRYISTFWPSRRCLRTPRSFLQYNRRERERERDRERNDNHKMTTHLGITQMNLLHSSGPLHENDMSQTKENSPLPLSHTILSFNSSLSPHHSKWGQSVCGMR